MDNIEMRHKIEDYFDQGVSIYKIAILLDVTEHTVKINLPSDKLKARILRLVKKGLSYTQIGEEVGLSSNTISSYVKGTKEEKSIINEIQLRFKSGESLDIIANDYSMGKQNIIRYIQDVIRFNRLEELYLIQTLPMNEICEKLGIGTTTLRNWINKSGLICKIAP